MDVGRIGEVTSLVVRADELRSPDFPEWPPEEAARRLSLGRGDGLVVDLSRIRHAKSDLFGYLARLKAVLAEGGNPVVLLLGDPELGRTLELLGLQRIFRVTWSPQEAVEACGAGRRNASGA